MGTRFSNSFRCITSKRLGLFAVALLAMGVLAATSSAQTCLQEEYNQVQKQKLNCTANDVRIAKVTNVRDPVTGATLTSCVAGSTFNFLADFEVVTSSAQSRENIGLYIATNSQTEALTGSCVDHTISKQHPCTTNTSLNCGSDNYHETDPAPDNCGDTSSGDLSGTFGAGAEKVTLEIDNFKCEAPAGSTQVQLPNCTSWQIPGGTIQCVSPSPDTYPFNGPGGTPTAIPGSPSKCNCGIIPLGITVQTPSINVAKACNTANTNSPNPPDFTNLSAPNPSSCTLSPEGGPVTYTVDMVNDKSNFGSVVIDQICDSAYGNIFTASTFTGPACAAGSQCVSPNNVAGASCDNTGTTCSAVSIAFGASSTCTFTANQPESTSVTDIVKVSGHGTSAGSFGPTPTNSVTVASNEAPSTATVTKGVASTTAACATVRYSVDVANTSASGTDETLSLTALNDSGFGGITSVHDSVLGTTCGVATSSSGLGTLSGSSGAGVLPASLPVSGSDYICQFDAQFCSALVNSCISNTDSITASLSGDEAADKVTVTANTVTVTECLSTTVK
jgi:hypothetical protein